MTKLIKGLNVRRYSVQPFMVVAERKIQDAIDEIEKMGADEKLTEALIKLMESRRLIAEYVDEMIIESPFD